MNANWSEIPTAEGWWWASDDKCWVEIASADLSTAIVDITWRGLWFGPIIIPGPPTPLRSLPDPDPDPDEFLPGAHGPGF